MQLAAEALTRCGFEPRYGLSGGAADANVFNERGLQCVNLANGMAEIHTPDEHIAVADLDAMVEVTLALVDAALAWAQAACDGEIVEALARTRPLRSGQAFRIYQRSRV